MVDDSRVRFCYHVQSHRSPAQLTRLVHLVRRMSPNSVVHVSHDLTGAPVPVAELRRLTNVEVQFHRGGYGDFSHVDRYLAAVDWLRADGVEVDWLVNLTGQDYPLRHLAECEAEVAALSTAPAGPAGPAAPAGPAGPVAGGVDGFMEHWPALGPDSHWGARRARSRYFFRHRRLAALSPRTARLLRPVQVVNRVQPVLRWHVSYGLVVGRRVRTPFGPDLVLHGGSAYSTLSWAAVEYLRDFLHSRPDVEEHFRHTLSPEEAVFPTILASSGKFRLDPDPKRYFDFRGSTFNHPKVLTLDDLPRAYASGAHFGRKFDMDSAPQVLDAVDAHLAV
jgi:hypothetical protein